MKVVRILIGLVLLVAAFAGGYGYNRWFGKGDSAQAGKGGRKILYYVDPMHRATNPTSPALPRIAA